MVKICYVIGTLEIGGAERQLLKLIKNIDREKFLPVLIALRGGALEEEFRSAVRVLVIGKKWKIDPFFTVKLIRAIKTENPGILHTFMFTSNTWGRIAGIAAGVPVIIVSERCVDIWKKWYHRLVDRMLLHFTFLVIGNSHAVREFYRRTEKIPAGKMTVIYNGVDLSEFEEDGFQKTLKEKLGILEAEFIIGAGGRFTEQKGFISLLRAVPAVLKVVPGSVFIFIGDGPLRASFEDFTDKNNLRNNVIFTGYRKDILKIFALCNIIAVPSLFEGMPNTVLEAMALKKPVVGTHIPEIAELVEDGNNGFLVPVRDNSEMLAERIVYLLRNPGICRDMGEKGYGIVKEKFSMEEMVRNYENCYFGALKTEEMKNVRHMRNNKQE